MFHVALPFPQELLEFWFLDILKIFCPIFFFSPFLVYS